MPSTSRCSGSWASEHWCQPDRRRELGWRVRDLGMASAVAWLLFLIIVVFALLNLFLSRRAGSLKGLNRKGGGR